MYKVFIQTNPRGLVTAINSDTFIADTTDWVQIDEGVGDRYHHAQGNYLTKSLTTMQGIYQYKLADGKAVERTAAEIAADVAKIPKAPPSAEDRIRALETKLTALEPTITALTRDTADLKLRPQVVKTLGGT